jgi:hypothetical protein
LDRIIFIQQTDSTYDSVDFDDHISTLSYFKKLYRSFLSHSEEEVDEMLNGMTLYFKEHGSKISAEVQAHHIMRSAAEKIHGAFRGLKRDMYAYTIADDIVTGAIQEVLEKFRDLLGDCNDKLEEDNSSN